MIFDIKSWLSNSISDLTTEMETTYQTTMRDCVPFIGQQSPDPGAWVAAGNHVTKEIFIGTVGDEYKVHEQFPMSLLPPTELELNYNKYVPELLCYPSALPWFSMMLVFFYLIMVHGGQYYMKDKKPWDLKYTMRFWNLFLAVFSAWGAIRIVPHLFAILANPDPMLGWTTSLCILPSRILGCWPRGVCGFDV